MLAKGMEGKKKKQQNKERKREGGVAITLQ